ncbi:MAG TPA: hypothetical protein VEB40_03435 [Flavipsychrobacter sp.]|nr:hypothetical protein [Flavipsychrobacter sp.]
MTRFILLVALAAFTYVGAQAQQDFKPALQKTFLAFDTTMNMEVKVEQSNKLGLIAQKWKESWETHYYNAYSKTMLSYMEKKEEKRDAYLDEAEKEMEETITILGKENDETHVLEAMIANARLAVNPMNRWQKFGKIFDDNLAEAKAINPDNPRIYYLQGTNKFYTPKAFGGGPRNAKPYFEKAQGLFAKEESNDISKPTWGSRANEYHLAQCNGDKD